MYHELPVSVQSNADFRVYEVHLNATGSPCPCFCLCQTPEAACLTPKRSRKSQHSIAYYMTVLVQIFTCQCEG